MNSTTGATLADQLATATAALRNPDQTLLPTKVASAMADLLDVHTFRFEFDPSAALSVGDQRALALAKTVTDVLEAGQ
ncbi:hypothetical protein ACFC08_28600 [Streptomyces sp. NPDC056112]|uniref:hypothetical protein n=1 Tax=Streptomyces sp. NPDC056112 TaxID=3345715 RepID=UPI0035D881A0